MYVSTFGAAAEIAVDTATLTEFESLIDIDTETGKQTRGWVEITEAGKLVGDSFVEWVATTAWRIGGGVQEIQAWS